MWQAYDEWVQSCGARPLADLEFVHESEYLNLYTYPEVIDYTDRRPLGANWHRLDSSVRATDSPFEVPAELGTDGALIYLSLGSLGSADVELMQRLIDVLGHTPHRYIVSKGPLHDTFDLPDEHVGRTAGAADQRVAPRRSGDHPRRQQHDHRVLPLRQADGGAAPVLGSVRQCPARARNGLRRALADVLRSTTPTSPRRSIDCWPTTTLHTRMAGQRRRDPLSQRHERAADLIEDLAR